MTSRRTRIQQHSVTEVQAAILDCVFGEDNRQIMTDLFVRNLTFQQCADKAHLSQRGLYKRVKPITARVEEQLNRLQ